MDADGSVRDATWRAPGAPDLRTPVTAPAPTWRPDEASGGGSWTTPAVTGVTYSPASGTAQPHQSITVTAVAQGGYRLVGTSSWTYVFPPDPTWVDVALVLDSAFAIYDHTSLTPGSITEWPSTVGDAPALALTAEVTGKGATKDSSGVHMDGTYMEADMPLPQPNTVAVFADLGTNEVARLISSEAPVNTLWLSNVTGSSGPQMLAGNRIVARDLSMVTGEIFMGGVFNGASSILVANEATVKGNVGDNARTTLKVNTETNSGSKETGIVYKWIAVWDRALTQGELEAVRDYVIGAAL